MKLSPRIRFLISKSALFAVALLFACQAAHAAQDSWTGNNGLWGTGSLWSTGTAAGSSDNAVFNVSGSNAAENVGLNATQAANSLTFNSTGGVTVLGSGTASAAGTAHNLDIGAGGITMNAGSGAVTFGLSNNTVLVTMAASFSVTNNSANLLLFRNAFEGQSGASDTLTLAGTGAGNINFSGAINDNGGTVAVVVDMLGTGVANLNSGYSGELTVKAGTAVGGVAALGGNSPTVLIGDTSGTQSATLDFNAGGAFNAALTEQAGNTGVNTVFVGNAAVITATNTVVLSNTSSNLLITGGNGASSITFSGVVSGAGGLTNSTGILILSASDTYSGSTVVSSGALDVDNVNALGSGTLRLAGGTADLATNTSVNANNVVVTGNATIISDLATSGTAITQQLGTLSIAGNTLTITSGGLGTSGTAAVAFGATTLSSTATATTTIAASTAGVTLASVAGSALTGGTDILSFTGTNANQQITGSITNGAGGGQVALTLNAATTLVLTGSDTYSGVTTLTSGSLQLGNGFAVQNSAVTVSANNSLQFNNSLSGTNTYTLGNLAGVGNFALTDVNGNAANILAGGNNTTSTYSGIMSGSGGLTKTGLSTLLLGGANTYSGNTTILSGFLEPTVSGALSSGTVFLGATSGTFNATLAPNSTTAITVANPIVVQAGTTGTLAISNFSGTANNVATFSGGVTLGSNGTGQNVTLTTANIAGVTDTFSGVIADPAGLSGPAGTVTIGTGASSTSIINLTGTNTYSGGTILNTANLFVGQGAVAQSLGSGTLTINSGGVDVFGAGAATLNNAVVLAGNFTGANSGGTLTLAGNVTLTGSRTISLVNSSVIVNGVIADNVTGSNFGLTFAGATVLGHLTLNGLNTFDGGMTVAGTGAGVVFNIGNLGTTTSASALGTGTFTIGTSGNVTGISINNTSGAAGTLSTNNAEIWNADFTFAGTNNLDMGAGAVSLGTLSGTNRTVTVTSGTFEVDGSISNGTATPAVTGIIKAGAGTLVLGGSNAYTGATTFSAGILNVANANALANSGTLTFTGGTLQYSGSNQADYSAKIANSTSAISIDTNGQNVTYANSFGGANSGGLTKLGAGMLTLSNSDSYTGTTTITTGTLAIGNNNSLGTGAISLGAAGTLSASGTATITSTNSSLTYAAGSTFGSAGTGNLVFTATNGFIAPGTINVNNAQTTVANQFQGSGGSTIGVAGTGNLTIVSDSSTFNGKVVTINAGATMQFGNGGTHGSVGGISDNASAANTFTDNGTLIFDHSDNISVTGAISGSGAVIQTGADVLTFAVANTFTGGLAITTGTVREGVTGILSDGIVTMSGSTQLDLNGFNPTIGLLTGAASANVTNSSGVSGTTNTLTIGVAGTTGTFAGTITNGASALTALTMNAANSVQVLSGSDSYSGVTTLSAGTLVATTATALGNNAGIALSGGTLSLLNNGAGNNGTIIYTGTAGAAGYNVTVSGATAINVDNNGSNTGNTIQLNALTIGAQTLSVTNGDNYNLSFSGTTTSSAASTFLNNMTSGTLTLATLAPTTATTVTFNDASATAVTSVGNITGANSAAITGTGAGTLLLTGSDNYTGATTVTGGALVLNGTLGASSVTNNATFTENSTGAINGAVTFTNGAAAGTTTLSGTNGYTGATTVTGGTLVLNGTLGASTVTNNATFTESATGAINGTGVAFTNGASAGTATLSGVNHYTGATTVNGGTLQLNLTSSSSNILLSTGTITLGGGTLGITGSNATGSAILQTTGSLGLAAGFSTVILADAGSATATSLTTTGNLTTPAAGITLYLNLLNSGSGALTFGNTASTGILTWATVTSSTGVTGFGQINSAHQLVLDQNTSELLSTSTSASIDYATNPLTDAATAPYISGTLTMTASNRTLDSLYITSGSAGTLNLSGSTLAFTSNNPLGMSGTANYTVTNGQLGASGSTLTIDSVATGTLFVNSQISSGAGAFTKTGTGLVVIGTAENYSGLTTVAGGVLQLGAGGSLNSTNALTTNVGGTFDLNGNSQTLGTVANNGTITSTSGTGALTIGNASSGSGLYTGTTNVIWNNGATASTFSGTWTNTGNITLNTNVTGGTINLSGSVGNIGSLTINANTANNENFTGTLNTTGTITNSGTGANTVTISSALGANVTGLVENSTTSTLDPSALNNSAFSGTVSILAGTLALAQGNGTNQLGTGRIILGGTGGSANATLQVTNAGSGVSANNPITVQGGSTGTLEIIDNYTSGGTTLGGLITLAPSLSGSIPTLTVDGGGGLGLGGGVTGTGNIIVVGPNPGAGSASITGANMVGTITNVFTGAGAITLTTVGSNVTSVTENSSTSALTLAGANSFTGGLFISNGLVSAPAGTALGSGTISLGSANTANNAELQTTSNSAADSNPFFLVGGDTGTLTIQYSEAGSSGSQTGSFSGAISGSNNVTFSTVQGAGDTSGLTFSGSFSFVGGITAIGNSTGNTTINSNLGANIAYVTLNNTAGGNLVLNGNNSGFSTGGGLVTITDGSLVMGGTAALGAGNAVATGTAGTFNLNGKTETVAGLNNGATGGGLVTGAGVTLTLGGSNSYSFGGTIASTMNLTVALTGTGSQTLSGSNTFSGKTSILGGTLSVATLATSGSAQPLGENSTLALGNGTLQYTGGTSQLFQNVTVGSGSSGTISNTGGGLLTVSGTITKNGSTLVLNGGSFNVTGQISGTSASFNSDLDVIGGAFVTLSATNNNYFGPTVVSGSSTLQNGAGVANALPVSTVLTLGGTTDAASAVNTYDLNGNNQSIAGLASAGSGSQIVTTSSNAGITLTLTGTNATETYGGVIQDGNGTMALGFSGGTEVLTGSDTYSGGTTITGGTLQLGNGGSTGSVNGNITDNGALVFNRSDAALNISAVISGSAGSVIQAGSGLTTLSGANTYTGPTSITSGTLSVAAAGTAGNANGGTLAGTAITVNTGGTLLVSASNALGTNSNVTLNGGTYMASGSSSEGAASSVGRGPGPFNSNVQGTGNLTLTAASTLDFGVGSITTQVFGSFTDAGNALLTIADYTSSTNINNGQSGVDGTDDRLIFDVAGGLTTQQLADISFGAGTTTGQINLGGNFYEVSVVPEPTTILAGLLLVGFLGLRERRRLSELYRRVTKS